MSRNPVFRRSPRHTQSSENLALVHALHQRPLGDLLAPFASHDVLVKASLIEAKPLRAGEQAQASVEYVVSYINSLVSNEPLSKKVHSRSLPVK